MKIIFILLLCLSACAEEVQKVFKIYTNDGTKEWCASAFYVTETNLLTAAHTFKNNTKNVFIRRDGTVTRCRLVKIDYKADVALIECPIKNADSYALAANGTIKIVGFPGEKNELAVTSGAVMEIQASAMLPNGMSGSPLVNDSGVVVGMGVRGDGKKHPCYAVPSDVLLKFLEKP